MIGASGIFEWRRRPIAWESPTAIPLQSPSKTRVKRELELPMRDGYVRFIESLIAEETG